MTGTARHAAGTPVGGQFATTTRDEPAITLRAQSAGDLVDVVDPAELDDVSPVHPPTREALTCTFAAAWRPDPRRRPGLSTHHRRSSDR